MTDASASDSNPHFRCLARLLDGCR